MTDVAVFGVAVTVLTLAVVLFEAARQRRRHGRGSGRPNLAGVGMLDLQRHLQADRRVGVLQAQLKEEAAQVEEDTGGQGKKN